MRKNYFGKLFVIGMMCVSLAACNKESNVSKDDEMQEVTSAYATSEEVSEDISEEATSVKAADEEGTKKQTETVTELVESTSSEATKETVTEEVTEEVTQLTTLEETSAVSSEDVADESQIHKAVRFAISMMKDKAVYVTYKEWPSKYAYCSAVKNISCQHPAQIYVTIENGQMTVRDYFRGYYDDSASYVMAVVDGVKEDSYDDVALYSVDGNGNERAEQFDANSFYYLFEYGNANKQAVDEKDVNLDAFTEVIDEYDILIKDSENCAYVYKEGKKLAYIEGSKINCYNTEGDIIAKYWVFPSDTEEFGINDYEVYKYDEYGLLIYHSLAAVGEAVEYEYGFSDINYNDVVNRFISYVEDIWFCLQ